MRIFALIPGLAAFATAAARAAVAVDPGCGLEIGSGDVESYIALSTVPSVTTIIHSGMIEVLDPNNTRLGYVSKNIREGGELMYDPLVANALIVTFATDQSTGYSTKLDITATNMSPPFAFLGLIQGYGNIDSDLKPNSYQYSDIGGISAPGTQPGAPPSNIRNSVNEYTGYNRTAESAVWAYNSTSQLLTPQWINTDGSSPHEDFFTQDTIFIVSGSKNAFYTKYPYEGPVTTITFKFVSA